MAAAASDVTNAAENPGPKKRSSFFNRRKKCLDPEETREKSSKSRKLSEEDDTASAKGKHKNPLTDLSNVVSKNKAKTEKTKVKDSHKLSVAKSKSDKAKRTIAFKRTVKKDKDKVKVQNEASAVSIPPKKLLLRDEPMESHHSPTHLPSLLTRRPSTVPNIDNRDYTWCPEYAQDIMNFSQAVEQKWVLPADFMAMSPLISPHMRSVLTDWLLQVQVHLTLLDHTLHLCVALIDKYLYKEAITLDRMQLMGITALFVAAKYYERFPPEINTLTHLTDNTYSYEDIIDMERLLLTVHNFDINFPTPNFFLDRFLMIEGGCKEVEPMCQYLLDLFLISSDVSHFPSSLRAAASLFIARLLLQCTEAEDAWTLSLAYYTKYSESQLLPCAKCIAEITTNANTQKYQGAFVKYSGTKFLSVSQHETIQSGLIVQVIDALMAR